MYGFHDNKFIGELNNLLSSVDIFALNDPEKISCYIKYRIIVREFGAALESYLHPAKDSNFDPLKQDESGLSPEEKQKLRWVYFDARKRNLETIYNGMVSNYAKMVPAHDTKR